MSTLITPEHEDYSDVHRAWVANGRPSQFDREGSFGGAVYRCLDTDSETPDFYEAFSLGPTEISDTGKVTSKGWHLINEDYLRVSFKVDREGRVKVTPPEFP